MESKTPLRILHDVGAVIADSHIVYTSGKHGSAYVNKDALYPHTGKTAKLCKMIAERVHATDIPIDIVIAPAIGGVILSQWIAYNLSRLRRREVFSGYAEKEENGDGFVIKRGYDKLVAGKNVLVVEDVLNTGGSVKKVVQAVKATGGTVVGVAALCNRGGVKPADIGINDLHFFFSLVDVALDAWSEAECPLCARGVPVNVGVGKGREFLARTAKA